MINIFTKSKRSQVTIFIILGLILVVSIALIFLVFRQPTLEVSPSGNPEAYIEKCMRDYGKEALNILMPQGGDIEPKGSIKYQGKDITYLCYNENFYDPCIMQRPMLIEHIESEISSYLEPRMQGCFSLLRQGLENKGYEIDMQSMSIKTELKVGKIFMTTNRKLQTTKDEETRKYEKFTAEISSPIYKLAWFAQEITSQEAKYCYFNTDGFNMNYPTFEARKEMIDDSKIYNVKDRITNQNFVFAIRGCVMPPGL